MSKIIIKEMNFHYEEYFNPVFEQVNLELDTDWRLGLIGRNGRGKTTFLKLLQGALTPVKGVIQKAVTMEYFPYPCPGNYKLSLDVIKEIAGGFKRMEDQMEEFLQEPTMENLTQYSRLQESYQQAGGYELEGQIQRELYWMGLSECLLEREFKQLSGGEGTKLMLIALFLRKNAFVLMDEPTNHLDLPGKQKVADYLKKKKGYLVVSHDRYFLDEVTDHILSINKASIGLEKGNYSSWKENVIKQEAFEVRTKLHLEKEISRLERGASMHREWGAAAEKEKNKFKSHNRGNGSRAAKFMRQAKNAEQELQADLMRKQKLLVNHEEASELFFLQQGEAKKRRLANERPEHIFPVKIVGLTFGYEDAPLFEDYSLQIEAGERLWIQGGNGSGKSTLLKLINGELLPGQFSYQQHVRFSCSYQESLWQDGYVREKITEPRQWERFVDICDALSIREELWQRPLQTYSSGEKAKIDIARALSEENDILLLDEPLNFMDLFFREQLEKAILQVCPTLVFVEHDQKFGSRVATRWIML